MVNLTFYRLDSTYSINSDNSEAQHSSISIFHIPFSGTVIIVGISLWSIKFHLIRCFPNSSGFLVICFRISFFRRDRRFHWSEGNQLIIEDHGSWFRFAGCCSLVSWWIFSNNLRLPFRSLPWNLFELFGFFWLFRLILFTSLPSYYFDLKSVWLPYFPFAFGSPPEDLLFRYLLFVTIR